MSDMPDGFSLLDHTADIGLEAHGPGLPKLFANAARGMFSIICDLDSIQPAQQTPVSVSADDLESLLVAWLSELLYLFNTRQMLFCRFEITEIDNRHIKAIALGEPIDLARHDLLTEIKAVTYHQLKIEKLPQGFCAAVLFDV